MEGSELEMLGGLENSLIFPCEAEAGFPAKGFSHHFIITKFTPPQWTTPQSLPDPHGILPIALGKAGRAEVIVHGPILRFTALEKTSWVAEDGG